MVVSESCRKHGNIGVNITCMVRTHSTNCEVMYDADVRVWQNSEFSTNDYENLVELYIHAILHAWQDNQQCII